MLNSFDSIDSIVWILSIDLEVAGTEPKPDDSTQSAASE